MFDVKDLIVPETQEEIGNGTIHLYEAQATKFLEADRFEFYVETGFNQSIVVPMTIAGYVAPRLNSDSLDESEHAITAGDFGWKILAEKRLRIKSISTKIEVEGNPIDSYIGDVYIQEVYTPEEGDPQVVWVSYADVMKAQGFDRAEKYELNPDEKPELLPRPETVLEDDTHIPQFED